MRGLANSVKGCGEMGISGTGCLRGSHGGSPQGGLHRVGAEEAAERGSGFQTPEWDPFGGSDWGQGFGGRHEGGLKGPRKGAEECMC